MQFRTHQVLAMVLAGMFASAGMAMDRGAYQSAEKSIEARAKAEHWLHRSNRKSRKPIKRYARQAKRYAEDAGDFARDHAKEGGALLAVATIAAAIGAAALENRRKGGFGKL